ncbi:MAG TPA: sporulation integral membrane protein YlbJ [Bacilli bacterium]
MIRNHLWQPVLIGCALAALLSLFIMYPGQALAAAVRGMAVWWEILFPALFPFFVISELLFGFGVIHFFGTILDPLMRPLFKVPGIGGFVMAMGFASGYPVAARLTAQLREQRLISRIEAERLVSFASTSDPIFLIGAVTVGFFGNPQLAGVLALSHYGGAVAVGLMLRFYGRNQRTVEGPRPHGQPPLIVRAFQAMHEARIRDGREFGAVMRDGVQTSIRMIIVVGGLVVFFSVVLELLSLVSLLDSLSFAVKRLLTLADLPHSLSEAVVNGFFEVTLGAKAAGHAPGAELLPKAAVAAFVLSWSGLSVHAQIVSLLARTDVRYAPFLFARMAHGLISFAIVLAAWRQIPANPAVYPVFHLSAAGIRHPGAFFAAGAFVSAVWLCLLLAALIIASLFFHCFLRKV